MYLIDTNIFLEVLLSQERMDICKKILDSNIGNKYLSDFSLHSIGAILFKNGKEIIFQKFSVDVVPKVEIITMDKDFNKVKDKIKITFI